MWISLVFVVVLEFTLPVFVFFPSLSDWPISFTDPILVSLSPCAQCRRMVFQETGIRLSAPHLHKVET